LGDVLPVDVDAIASSTFRVSLSLAVYTSLVTEKQLVVAQMSSGFWAQQNPLIAEDALVSFEDLEALLIDYLVRAVLPPDVQ